jgi:hypothetical protein
VFTCVDNDFAACEGADRSAGFCLAGGCLVFEAANAHPAGSYERSVMTHLTENSGGVWASINYSEPHDAFYHATTSLVMLEGLNAPQMSANSTVDIGDVLMASASYSQISGSAAVGTAVDGTTFSRILRIYDGLDWTSTHGIITALDASSTTDDTRFNTLAGVSLSSLAGVSSLTDFFFVGKNDLGEALGKRCTDQYHDDPGPPVLYHHHYICDMNFFWGSEGDSYSPVAAYSIRSSGFQRHTIADYADGNGLFRAVDTKAATFDWDVLGASTYASGDAWKDIHGSSTSNIWMVGTKGLLAWYDGSTFHDYSDWFVTGPGSGMCEAGDTCTFDYNGVYTDGKYVYIAGRAFQYDDSAAEETTRAFLFIYDMTSAFSLQTLDSLTCALADTDCRTKASKLEADDVWVNSGGIYVVGGSYNGARQEAVFWFAAK